MDLASGGKGEASQHVLRPRLRAPPPTGGWSLGTLSVGGWWGEAPPSAGEMSLDLSEIEWWDLPRGPNKDFRVAEEVCMGICYQQSDLRPWIPLKIVRRP